MRAPCAARPRPYGCRGARRRQSRHEQPPAGIRPVTPPRAASQSGLSQAVSPFHRWRMTKAVKLSISRCRMACSYWAAVLRSAPASQSATSCQRWALSEACSPVGALVYQALASKCVVRKVSSRCSVRWYSSPVGPVQVQCHPAPAGRDLAHRPVQVPHQLIPHVHRLCHTLGPLAALPAVLVLGPQDSRA